MNMKTAMPLFAVGLIAAVFTAANVRATPTLPSPHWNDAPQIFQSADSTDSAHRQTALGNAARSKAAGPTHVTTSAQTDPNLVACNKVGKASYPKCGIAVPCCTTKVYACCN
jgi:hypothetical protein